jgi:NADH-quinone oxidoreductase subunit N
MEFTFVPTATDWARFSPELALAAAALLVLLADLVVPARRHLWLAVVALLGVAGSAVAVGVLIASANYGSAFFNMVTSDPAALLAEAIILTALGLSVALSPAYLERQDIAHRGEYYALLVLAAAGMMLMASAANLMTIFVGIELLSLCLYILSAFAATRLSSQEAGMKYFLLSSFASAFLLYGMALTYGATGATSLVGIGAFLQAHPYDIASGYGPLLTAGFALLAVGFCFKVAGVPFHTWTPDVYVGAPTTVTAFMSVGTKVAAFLALGRTFYVALPTVQSEWQPIFWVVAVLSMVFGNILAVSQSDVKRLLAYSSIAHAGYILVGIATGALAGLVGVLVYLACYCVMNVGAFGAVALLEQRGGAGTTLRDVAGLARRRPGIAAALAICLFALAGFPPSAGFVGKYAVFYAAITNGHGELAIIGVLASVFGMFYYLRVIWAMYFTEPVAAGVTKRVAPARVSPGPAVALASTGAPLSTSGSSATESSATSTALAVEVAPARIASGSTQERVATVSPVLTGLAGAAVALAALLTIAVGIFPGPLFDFAQQAVQMLAH